MNNRVIRQVKASLRRAAPGLTAALQAWVNNRRGASAATRAIDRHRSTLSEVQRRFDAAYPIDGAALQAIATASSLIVVTTAPFVNASSLIDELAQERIVLGELVIVDATAETPRGVAIRDHVAAWRLRLPLTRLTIVAYSRQDLVLGHAIQEGFAAARHANIWIAGRDYVPLSGGIEYLLKAFIVEQLQSVVVTQVLSPDGQLRRVDIPAEMLSQATFTGLAVEGDLSLLDANSRNPTQDLPALPLIAECTSFRRGIFGGDRRHLLTLGDTNLVDTWFVTDAAIADLALRLRRSGTKLVQAAPSVAVGLRAQATDAAAPWEAIHDWRWLLRKHGTTPSDDADLIELVCPFHRGDLMLAIQVAAHVAGIGKRIRLHTAASLLAWVRDIDPNIDVEPIPIGIASAVETYPQLLAAYRYVAQRPDASPRLARCHPARTLSETDASLLGYLFEQVGLAPDTLLTNVKPAVSTEQQQVAQQIMQPLGDNVVFVHPVGGWGLKSIPRHIWPLLVDQVHGAGFKLVQIGGAADPRFGDCDEAILRDFLPSQWRAILSLGRGLIGVDSWTAHFASILDLPQVTLYGSTHPRHVNTKAWFVQRTGPSLIMGPVVNCSPCNSLTCVAFAGRDYCTGYAIDSMALQNFLTSL